MDRSLSHLDRNPLLVNLLLIEDNPGDVRLIQEALSLVEIPLRLHIVENASDALRFLRNQGDYQEAPKPGLIISDLNLPGISGHDLLKEVKNDPKLVHIPFLIMSTSENEDEVRETYNLQASCYLSKPGDLDQYIEMIQTALDFWVHIAALPK
jgi:two-component system, chemotaxis family, response regulator Rcp1